MRILCDTHTHTIFSRHAYSTIEECVCAAAERGLELYAATDHFSAMLFPDRPEGPDLRDYQFFLNLHDWPRLWHGVEVLRGCEADIVDLEGHLFGHDVAVTRGIAGDLRAKPTTLMKQVFEQCDYVVASVHGQDFLQDATYEQVTEVYLRALAAPKVLTLGHIDRTDKEFDVAAVLEAARDAHRLIEINEASLARRKPAKRCRAMVELCAKLRCLVVVNSDTHIAYKIGCFDRALALLDELGFPEELVANRTAESFHEALAAAGLEV
jgi:putative hydrolase